MCIYRVKVRQAEGRTWPVFVYFVYFVHFVDRFKVRSKTIHQMHETHEVHELSWMSPRPYPNFKGEKSGASS